VSDASGLPGARRRQPSNLQLRVMSAIVLIVVVLAVTWLGGPSFRILCALIAAAVLYEWLAMTAPSRRHAMLLAVMMALFVVAMLVPASSGAMFLLLAVLLSAGCAHALASRLSCWPALGLAYAGCGALSLMLLRGGDAAGLSAIVFLFAVVWATDILAYFVGKAIGGPKLAPSISPGKTWSGAVGGAVGGTFAGLIVAQFVPTVAGMTTLCVTALALSAVSQAGDLFESSLKRRFSVKDSGRLIPGHGGVMDRVDGLVASAFVFYLVGALVAGPDISAEAFFAG
jgi:phosphatidate cytidylyltransferase